MILILMAGMGNLSRIEGPTPTGGYCFGGYCWQLVVWLVCVCVVCGSMWLYVVVCGCMWLYIRVVLTLLQFVCVDLVV